MSDIKQIPLSAFGNALLHRQAAFQASAEADKEGKWPKGKKMTVDEVAEKAGPEFKEQHAKNKDKFKPKSAADETDADAGYADGEKLTGTYWGALGRQELTGTVKGDAVAFSFQSPAGRVTYKGQITGATFAGSCDYSQLGSGTFKGQKAGTAAI